LEDYATGNFNLISEDDVEKQTIDDFSDDEIMEEVRVEKYFVIISLLFQETSLLDSQKIEENQILLTMFLQSLNIN
jgi:hypothetical protein